MKPTKTSVALWCGLIWFLIGPIKSHATELTECQAKAEIVRTIKQEYDKGTNKGKLLLAFQGRDDLDRVIRNVIHGVYRGQFDDIPAQEMYQVTLDICKTRED